MDLQSEMAFPSVSDAKYAKSLAWGSRVSKDKDRARSSTWPAEWTKGLAAWQKAVLRLLM